MKNGQIEPISNPEDQKKLLEIIKACSDSMTRAAAEKYLVKEAVGTISKELGIPKAIINKMVKVFFKQSYDEEVAIQEQFENLYQTVIK